MRDLAEAFKSLSAHVRSLEGKVEELSRKLEEHSKAIGEHTRVLEEHTKILTKMLEEHSKLTRILEEHSRVLEEHGRKLEEQTVVLGTIGRRWGVDTEKMVLNLLKYALEKRGIEPGRVERFFYKDVDGRYTRRGSIIEVDIYMHDDKVYLLEVKSHARYADIEWFYEKALVVEKILGRKIDKLIVVAVNIDREAFDRAMEYGMDVVYGAVID